MRGMDGHGKFHDVSRKMSDHEESLYETHIFSGGKFSMKHKDGGEFMS